MVSDFKTDLSILAGNDVTKLASNFFYYAYLMLVCERTGRSLGSQN